MKNILCNLTILLVISMLIGVPSLVAQDNNDRLLVELENISKRTNKFEKIDFDAKNVIKKITIKNEKEISNLISESRNKKRNEKYRYYILLKLSDIHNDTVAKTFIEDLNDLSEDENIRAYSARALSKQNKLISAEPLINSLSDNSSKVRANAAYSLGIIKEKGAIKRLLNSLLDTDNIVSVNAIWALGEIGDEVAINNLLNIIDNKDETKKINIIIALGKIGGKKAKNKLLEIKNNSSGLMLELIEETIRKTEGAKK